MASLGSETSETAPLFLGIAIGNHNSSIAYMTNDGTAECIANEDGDHSIPCAISFADNETHFASHGTFQHARHPDCSILAYRDSLKTNDSFKLGENTKTTEELLELFVGYLKSASEHYFSRPISGCVLTVPADFDHDTRQRFHDAAEKSGLSILQLVEEPAAQCLAVLPFENSQSDKNVLVADFGASRTDISIVAVRGGLLTLLANSHDSNLGGNNLDDLMLNYLAEQFDKSNKTDIKSSAKSMNKLRSHLETLKKTLCKQTSGTIAIESLFQDKDYSATINRLKWEMTCRPVFEKMESMVLATLKKANLEPAQIDDVILSGGTSFAPKITRIMYGIFSGLSDDISVTIHSPASDIKNPAELSALGAAMQASLVGCYELADIEESTHAIVANEPHLAHTIGIVTSDKESMIPILREHSPLVARRTVKITGVPNNSDKTKFCFDLFEGEFTTESIIIKHEIGDDSGNDDDDDDEEEEEEETQITRKYKPITKLAQVELPMTEEADVEITVQVDHDLRLTFTAKSTKGSTIRGIIEKN